MDTDFVAVLGGLIYNAKAAEFFLDSDYSKEIFYDFSDKTDLQHGEKEALFLAQCATTFYDRHSETVPWSFVMKMLKKKRASSRKIAAYKKLWGDVKRKRKIKLGTFKEHLDSVLTQYRQYRHKNVFYQTAKLHALPCLGGHGTLEQCDDCEFVTECKQKRDSDIEDPTVWILDWSAAETEQIKLDTKATHIEVFNVGELMEEALDRLDVERNELDDQGNKKILGIPTPWNFLTRHLGGFCKERVYMVASRSGVGKSAWLLQCADHAASLGYPVLYFNLEMPVRDELIYRIIAYLCNADFGKLMKRDLDDKIMGLIRETAAEWLDRFEGYPNFEIVDIPKRSKLTTIYRFIDRFITKVGTSDILVIVDYFNILHCPPNVRRPDLYWGDLAGDLHAFARYRHIPILSALQLNRLGDGVKKLSAKHLRESDKIMDNIDWMGGLLSISEELLKMVDAKARYDKKSTFFLKKALHRMAFEEYTRQTPSSEEEDDDDDFLKEAA